MSQNAQAQYFTFQEEVYKELKDEIQLLRKQNHLLTKEIKAHESFKEKKEENHDQKTQEEKVSRLEKENRSLNEALVLVENEKKELESKFMSSIGKIKDLEVELELQFHKLSSRENYLESQKQELESLKSEHENVIINLERENENLKQTASKTKDEMAELLKEIELDAIRKIAGYSKEIDIQNQIYGGMTKQEVEREMEKMKKEITMKTETLERTKLKLNDSEVLRNSLEEEVRDLKEQVRNAKRIIIEQANDIGRQEKQLETLEKNSGFVAPSQDNGKVEMLTREIESLRNDYQSLKKRRDDENSEKSELIRQIGILNNEIKSVEKHYEELLAEANRKNSGTLGSGNLGDENKMLASLIEENKKQSRELKKSQERLTELREEVRLYKGKLEEINKELQLREKNDDGVIDQLERQIYTYAEALKIKDKTLGEKEEEIKKLQVQKTQWICKKCEATAMKTKRDGGGTTVTIGGGTTAIVRHGSPSRTKIFDPKSSKGSLKTTAKYTIRKEEEPPEEEKPIVAPAEPENGFAEFYTRWKEASDEPDQKSLLNELVDDQATITDGAINLRPKFLDFLSDLLSKSNKWFQFHGVLISYQNLLKNRLTIKNLQGVQEVIPAAIQMANPENAHLFESYMSINVPLDLLKLLVLAGISIDPYWSEIIENKFLEASTQLCQRQRKEEEKLTGIILISSICDVEPIQKYFGTKGEMLEAVIGLTSSVNLEIKRRSVEALSFFCKLFEVREFLNNEKHAKLIVSLLTRMQDVEVITHTLYTLANYSLTHWGNKVLGEEAYLKRLLSFFEENNGKWKAIILQSVLNVTKSKKVFPFSFPSIHLSSL